MVCWLVRSCHATEHFPSRIFCIFFLIIQAASLDYYLVEYENTLWSSWAAADCVVIMIFTITFVTSYQYHKKEEKDVLDEKIPNHLYLAIFAWFLYTAILSIKVGYFFYHYVPVLDEADFFGPNTLKTTVAIAGVVYIFLLFTLHDAVPGSARRKYIDEMTSTVLFDILDCVESLEVLFLHEARKDLIPSVEIAIIAIACLNFLLPVLPLMTLSRTNFGHKKILSHAMIIAHKLLLAFLVNLPLLICRMIIWHGVSHGVSIFSLKNCIIVTVVLYDVYETYAYRQNVHPHLRDAPNSNKKKPPPQKRNVNGVDRYVLTLESFEDRFNPEVFSTAVNTKVRVNKPKRGSKTATRGRPKEKWRY